MLPRSGRQVPEYGSEDVREILERPYRIIYRILSDHIDVLSVMHYRRLLPEDMDKL
jgi:plasmid stabilization system protein ParE